MGSSMKEDWIGCALEEVCEKALKVKRKEMPSSEKIKYLDIGGIDNHLNKIISHKDYTWADAPSRAQQIIKKDDILFSTVRTYLRNVAKVNREDYNEEIASSGFTVLRAKKDILNSDYLFFRTLSTVFLNTLNKLQRGTSYPAVRDKDVFAQIIPLPPLVEQKAIVDKIEALFSSLDSGIADLKKAQYQLVIYRQAVLKKAFDLNLKEHKIEEICKEIFAGGDKPKDFFSKEKTEECSVPIIANAVANNGLYGYTKTARVNDISITIAGRGSGTGHVELRNEPFVPIVRLITLIPDLEKVVPKYLMYFLKNLNIKGTGSAIPQLTIPTVKSYIINLPSIEKQHQIVQEIESRLSVCDKVEKDLTDSLEKAQALRQSILKKAFEGKLLSEEEIAKCKADKDYEPASVLLERIKAEKKKK